MKAAAAVVLLLPADSSRRTLGIQWQLRDGQWSIREVQELQ